MGGSIPKETFLSINFMAVTVSRRGIGLSVVWYHSLTMWCYRFGKRNLSASSTNSRFIFSLFIYTSCPCPTDKRFSCFVSHTQLTNSCQFSLPFFFFFFILALDLQILHR
ncbi:hypothetical protein VNO78_22537 [Psophocarpus tetragonolobus]|uniref:Uncharacterized protein n=1 Tax=Psophocarpus tetragonolobus TaxID=3891 RepID=A0AAN9S1S9_PSOTE